MKCGFQNQIRVITANGQLVSLTSKLNVEILSVLFANVSQQHIKNNPQCSESVPGGPGGLTVGKADHVRGHM